MSRKDIQHKDECIQMIKDAGGKILEQKIGGSGHHRVDFFIFGKKQVHGFPNSGSDWRTQRNSKAQLLLKLGGRKVTKSAKKVGTQRARGKKAYARQNKDLSWHEPKNPHELRKYEPDYREYHVQGYYIPTILEHCPGPWKFFDGRVYDGNGRECNRKFTKADVKTVNTYIEDLKAGKVHSWKQNVYG